MVYCKDYNKNESFKAKSSSEVEAIMDICDQMKKKVKDISRIIMYSDVKKILKENIADIDRIK